MHPPPSSLPGAGGGPPARGERLAILGLGTAGLALAGVFCLLASRDLLLPGVGAVAAALAVFHCYRYPEPTFLMLLALSLLVPLDLAVTAGGLPRLGPTRAFLLCWYCGAGLRLLLDMLATPGAARRPPRPALPAPVLYGAVGYLLFGAVGCWFSVAPTVSLNAVIGRDLLEQLLLGVVFCYYFSRDGFRRRLMTVLMVCTLIICLLSFLEFIFQYNPLIPLYADPDEGVRLGFLRARGTFFHSIAYGVFLNLLLPLVWAEAVAGDTRPRRRFALVLVFIMVGGSAVSLSRAPWMILALQILILCTWLYHHHLVHLVRLATVTALATAVAVGLYLFEPNFHRLFYGIVNPTRVGAEATEYYRWVLIRAVWEHMQAGGDFTLRVLVGYGPGAFQKAGVQGEFASVTRLLQAPDLHYVRLAFEYGVLAAAAFGGLLLLALRYAWRAWRRHEASSQAAFAVACFCSLLGFILVNFTVSMFPQYPLGMLFWMVLALSLNLDAQGRPPPRPAAGTAAP